MSFCECKNLDITHSSVKHGLNFLSLVYKQRVACSVINTARSALPSIITPADKTTLGEHPLVSQFLKGTFELTSSLPRYSTIWDVGGRAVLKYLQSFQDLNELTLKQLTTKPTMLLAPLLALFTAHRTQTLSISCMQKTTTGIIFSIRDTLKTTRPGKHLAPIDIQSLTPDSRFTR